LDLDDRLPLLIEAFLHDDFMLRQLAEDALEIPEAVPYLLDIMASDPARVMCLLGRLRDQQATLPILRYLADTRLRGVCLEALVLLADPRATATLLPYLASRRESERHLAARTIAQDTVSIPTLLQLLETSPDPVLRTIAAEGLGKWRVKSAIPLLMQALNDRVGEVRVAATDALALIGASAITVLVDALIDADYRHAQAAHRALVSLGGQAVPELKLALYDDHLKLAMAVAVVLSDIDTDVLDEALHSGSPIAEYAARVALENR
jgi:HEAT repeat protein